MVVGFGSVEHTLQCLKSLDEQHLSQMRVVYVDNHSDDEVVRRIGRHFPEITLLRTQANVGFARASNIGIHHALAHGADLVFLLNNDTSVDDQAIKHLLAEAQADDSAGLLIPTITYMHRPDRIWSAGARYRKFPPSILLNHSHVDSRYVDFTTACALMVKREVFEKIGIFDPNFFFTQEDFDFCLRARDAGFNIRYVPEATVRHVVGGTGDTSNCSIWRLRGEADALFVRKHGNRLGLNSPTRWIHTLLARFLLKGRIKSLFCYVGGFRSGWKSRPCLIPTIQGENLDMYVDVTAATRERKGEATVLRTSQATATHPSA